MIHGMVAESTLGHMDFNRNID